MWNLYWTKWYRGTIFSKYSGFSCQFFFHQIIYTRLSSGAGTVDALSGDVPSGLSLTPLHGIKTFKITRKYFRKMILIRFAKPEMLLKIHQKENNLLMLKLEYDVTVIKINKRRRVTFLQQFCLLKVCFSSSSFTISPTWSI
jgi:hypothetical protein